MLPVKQRITGHNQKNSTIMSLAVLFQHRIHSNSHIANSTLSSVSIVVVFLRLDTINWMAKWHDQFTSAEKKTRIQFTPAQWRTVGRPQERIHSVQQQQTIHFRAKSKSTRFSSRWYWIHQWDFNARNDMKWNCCKEGFLYSCFSFLLAMSNRTMCVQWKRRWKLHFLAFVVTHIGCWLSSLRKWTWIDILEREFSEKTNFSFW